MYIIIFVFYKSQQQLPPVDPPPAPVSQAHQTISSSTPVTASNSQMRGTGDSGFMSFQIRKGITKVYKWQTIRGVEGSPLSPNCVFAVPEKVIQLNLLYGLLVYR